MKAILSAMALVCFVTLAGLFVFPGPSDVSRITGLGGTHGILVPAGDDGIGGH